MNSTLISNKTTLLMILIAGLFFSVSLDLYFSAPDSIINPGLMIVSVVGFTMAMINLFMWGKENGLIGIFCCCLALALTCGLIYHLDCFPEFTDIFLFYGLYNTVIVTILGIFIGYDFLCLWFFYDL